MKREDLHEADTLVVRVTVRDKAADGTVGAVVDLTAVTLSCAMGAPDQVGVAGTVVPVSLAAGVVDVIFPAVGNIASPYVVAQLRATRGGVTQTVWEQSYTLKPSILVA